MIAEKYFFVMLKEHHQLLIVTTRDWSEKLGELRLYERIDSAWMLIHARIPVVVGEAGLAWGIGLHPMGPGMAPCKREGDGASPAGLFSLGTAFGFAKLPTKMDFLYLHSDLEAIDDPTSRYYNCMVDRRAVCPDWQSSEKMREEPLYEMGIVVNHNTKARPGAGSAIFLHIWESERAGTKGCTAMSREHLSNVLAWLDKQKNPALVQLPVNVYQTVQNAWSLPKWTELDSNQRPSA